MNEYSQGIMGDGVAILKNGQPLTPEQIISELEKIERMAMLMKMMLTEREANRKAKRFLQMHDLMGSPLRSETNWDELNKK